MPQTGTFSGGGLGMGVAFTLKDGFTGAAERIKQSQKGLVSSTTAMSNKVNASLNTMFSGAKLVAAGGLLAAPFILGISKSKEFNEQMSKVYAVSRIEDEKTQQALKKTALELGTATKFTATQAAEGMNFLAMAGFDANQQIEAMPGLLSLAAAGNTDLALTSDIVSDTLTAMGMAASQTGQLADEMAATITRSNTDITQMGEALKYATAQADNLGATSAELNAMIGIMGDVGLKGSVAGTGINQMLTKLSELPNKTKALKKLGLTSKDLVDVDGNMRSMSEVIPALSKSFKEFGAEFGNVKQANLLQEVFQIRGAKAFSAFLKSGAKDYKDFVGTIEGDQGAANRIAEKMLDNLAGDITKLSSIVDTTLINLGDSVESGMRPVVQVLAGVITLFNKFAQSKVGKFVLQLTAAIAGLTIAFGLLKIVSGGLRWSMLKLKTAMATTATSTFVLAGAAIVIVGAILAVKKAMSAFSGATDEQIEKAKGLQKIFLKIGGVFTGLKEILGSITDEGFELNLATENKLEKLGILGTVRTLGVYIGNLRGLWIGFSTVFIKQAKSIWEAIKPVFKSIGGLIGIFTDLGSNVSNSASSFDTFKTAGEAIAKVVTLLTILFVGYKAVMFAATLAQTAFKVVMVVGGAIMKAYTAVMWLANGAMAFFATTTGAIVLGLAAVGIAIAALIIYWDELVHWVKTSDNWFAKFLNGTVNALISAFEYLKELWSDLVNSDFMQGVSKAFGTVKDFITGDAAKDDILPSKQLGNSKGSAESTADKIINNSANANKPVIVTNTNTSTKEVGDIHNNVFIDGTPLSSMFVKNQKINNKRAN